MGIEELQNFVLEKQRVLGKIFSDFGNLSVAEYASQWQFSPRLGEEQERIIKRIGRMLAVVYGQEAAGAAEEQLLREPLVSTIDHLGIFGHPFFLNSNLIYSLRGRSKYLICLATAGVSLNNSSWPGSLLVSGGGEDFLRLSLFRDSQKTQAVLAVKSFSATDVRHTIDRLKVLPIESEQRVKLMGMIEDVFLSKEVLEEKSFSRQACLAAPRLWAAAFPDAPALLYLPLEELVSDVLREEIIPDPNNILHRLLFTAPGWTAVEKYFHGSLGAFLSSHKGSFLFWGLKNNGHRVHLARSGKNLSDHGFSVSLDTEGVGQALSSGRLYPTSLVCFFVLLYYNLTCLGGFNQVSWLTEIKLKFAALLEEWDERGLAGRILSVPTGNFAESSLAFGINRAENIYKPTALDIFLQGGGAHGQYQRLAREMTVAESIACQLPEIYRVVTPGPERDPELLKITETGIMRRLGLEQKIRKILV